MKDSKISDVGLVDLFKAGQQEAFEEIIAETLVAAVAINQPPSA